MKNLSTIMGAKSVAKIITLSLVGVSSVAVTGAAVYNLNSTSAQKINPIVECESDASDTSSVNMPLAFDTQIRSDVREDVKSSTTVKDDSVVKTEATNKNVVASTTSTEKKATDAKVAQSASTPSKTKETTPTVENKQPVKEVEKKPVETVAEEKPKKSAEEVKQNVNNYVDENGNFDGDSFQYNEMANWTPEEVNDYIEANLREKEEQRRAEYEAALSNPELAKDLPFSYEDIHW